MQAEVVTELDRLEEFAPGWDALAVASNRPRSSPVLTLAWYRHAMPVGTKIRAVIVSDGDSVVGAAPFYVVRSSAGFYRYELAAPMLHGVEPLCAPGRDDEVWESMAVALGNSDPAPDSVSLDWLLADSSLPQAFRRGWPGRPPVLIDGHTFVSPHVMIAGCDFEAWLRERSKNFRNSVRSDHRKLRAEGFEHRMSTEAADVIERLPQQQRLYERRRADRGGSGPPFDGRFLDMVSEAVERSETGRLRLSTFERPGEVIATDLIINAGMGSSSWIRGFDDAWANLSPGRANLALCVEDSMLRGEEIFDLGPGVEPYKSSFTGDEATLQGHLLVRRGLRPFHTPAQLLPYAARQAAGRFVGRLRHSE